jgi:hypothetical protein
MHHEGSGIRCETLFWRLTLQGDFSLFNLGICALLPSHHDNVPPPPLPPPPPPLSRAQCPPRRCLSTRFPNNLRQRLHHPHNQHCVCYHGLPLRVPHHPSLYPRAHRVQCYRNQHADSISHPNCPRDQVGSCLRRPRRVTGPYGPT